MCNASNDSIAPRSGWFWRWFRERIVTGWWWFVPLGLSIARAGGHRDWFIRTLVAMFALITLRFWDDIEDITHDRIRHPERVLSQIAVSVAHTPCIAGLVMASSLVLTVGNAGVVFVVMLPMLYLAARLRKRMGTDLRVFWAHIILLKIPALVIALARKDEATGNVWGRAIGLYGFVGGYEVLHDRDLRRSPWAPFLLGMDISCIVLGLTVGTTLPAWS
jgi:hypothetical protein